MSETAKQQNISGIFWLQCFNETVMRDRLLKGFG